MSVVTFTDYQPIPRFDGFPWTHVIIQESEFPIGPWVQIDDKAIIPIDADPRDPETRSFTTVAATKEIGWYRLGWKDAAGNTIMTDPVQNIPMANWLPSLADVGEIVLARTRDANGNITQTFDADTNPTADQVYRLILRAADDVLPKVGNNVPPNLADMAGRVCALRTAMLIELTLFSNEVARNVSPYPQYKALYDEQMPQLVNSIAAERAGEDLSGDTGGTMAQFTFPDADNLLMGRLD